MDSNNYSFEVKSGSLDSNIEYSKYFAGFVISGGDGTIYSIDDVLDMSISSNTTFEVKWANKCSVAVTWNNSNGAESISYGSWSHDGKGKTDTFYVMSGTSVVLTGKRTTYATIDVDCNLTYTPNNLSPGILSDLWADKTYTITINVSTNCTITLS